MSERGPISRASKPIEPIEPIEIDPPGGSKLGEWVGFAVLLIGVAGVIVLLLVWLTGSILIAVAVGLGMIGAMVLMGYLASSSLGGRS